MQPRSRGGGGLNVKRRIDTSRFRCLHRLIPHHNNTARNKYIITRFIYPINMCLACFFAMGITKCKRPHRRCLLFTASGIRTSRRRVYLHTHARALGYRKKIQRRNSTASENGAYCRRWTTLATRRHGNNVANQKFVKRF